MKTWTKWINKIAIAVKTLESEVRALKTHWDNINSSTNQISISQRKQQDGMS